VDIAHYARPRDCDSGLFVLNLFQSDVNVITVTLLIMRFEDIKQNGNAVDINTEGDSNHVTECPYDYKPSTVYWYVLVSSDKLSCRCHHATAASFNLDSLRVITYKLLNLL